MIVTPLALAQASQRAYDDPPALSKGGVEILRIEAPSAVIYAFRGTSSNGRDILTDLRGLPWRDPDLGWCHSGFVKGVRAIWPDLLGCLIDDRRNILDVYFTGHSKGAAEATEAAALSVVTGYPVAGLAGFGSPRVGFARLGGILALTPCRLYKHGRDAITGHPSALWGYRHIIDLTKIGDGGFRFPSWSKKIPKRYTDHKIAGYVKKMTALTAAGSARAAWPATLYRDGVEV